MTETLVLTRCGEDAATLIPSARGDVRVEEWRPGVFDAEGVSGSWARIVLALPPSDAMSAGRRSLELLALDGDVVVPLAAAEAFTSGLLPLRPIGHERSGDRVMVVFGREPRASRDWSWSALGDLGQEVARSREQEARLRLLLRAALDREVAILAALGEHHEAVRARVSFRDAILGLRRFAASGRWWVRQAFKSRRRGPAS